MENLHDCHGRTVEKIGKVKALILGSPPEQPVRIDKPGPFPKRIKGENVSVCVRVDDTCYLADLRAFADGVIELGRLPSPETLDVEQLKQAIERGRVCSSLAAGSRVELHPLCSFTVREEEWSREIEDNLRSDPA